VLELQQFSVCLSVVNLATLGGRRHPVAQEMAPKKKVSRRPKGGVPSVADVRTALLHLAELAAGFEGRGVTVTGANDARDRVRDAATLTKVTALLLKHRSRQRDRQRNAVYGFLMRVLGAKYRDVRDADDRAPLDIQDRIVEAFAPFGFELSDSDLDELVILPEVALESRRTAAKGRSNGAAITPIAERELDELTIKDCFGPSEAAKATLARVLDRGLGTLGTAKREAEWLPLARVAFGHWVGSGALHEYLDERSRPTSNSAKPFAGSMSSLHDVSEAAGQILDPAVERMTRELFTTTGGLLMLVTEPPGSERVRKWQDDFYARCSLRNALVWVLIGDELALAQRRIAGVPQLGQLVLDAARALIAALTAGDEPTIEHAARALRLAVFAEVLESDRARLTEHLASL
jgi:hypothetical protein